MRYSKMDVSLTITDPKNMLTHHKRIHGVENIAEEPIQTILHGIATDVSKSFVDLNVRTSDETGKELKIIGINFDKPYQKEFTTTLNKPVYNGEKNRSYTLEYDAEEPERYFENYFAINCKKYTISLMYPPNAQFKPVIYEVNVEDESKTKSRTQPVVKKAEDGLRTATWTKTDVLESQIFRVEW